MKFRRHLITTSWPLSRIFSPLPSPASNSRSGCIFRHLAPQGTEREKGILDDPSQDILVDLFSMEDPENPDLGPRDLIHHAVVPNPKLPIPLQGTFERRPILLGGSCEAGCNRTGDALPNVWRRMVERV